MRRYALRALALALTTIPVVGCQSSADMSITTQPFGAVDGQPVDLYTLINANGLEVRITEYGGIVTHLIVPDRDGNPGDIVLGFDTVDEYVDHNPYFGAMVGRVGNRIANGRFTLDGSTYQLAANNGPHHLHGGVKGWDKVVWSARPVERRDGPALELTYVSADGDEGYPGEVTATVVYQLTNDDELRVEMTATTTEATPVNIVHHSYWNLAGHDAGTVLEHELQLNAASYTPADATLIPTGAIDPVAGTPFDFRESRAIGEAIDDIPTAGADDPGGYDLNYVVDGSPGTMRRTATVHDPDSGRVMEISATTPGIQFYSGNFLDDVPGKGGAVYSKHGGFCLETQHYPDSINKAGQPGWPSIVLRPGETYTHIMVHRFRTK